jgi:hypothetical protein
MAPQKSDPAVDSEPTVKVDMDIAESLPSAEGGRNLIQIRIWSASEDARTRVTKAIELAVRTMCEDTGEPARHMS